MIFGFFYFTINTLSSVNLYTTDWASKLHVASMCQVLLGCFILLMGRLGNNGFWSKRFFHGQQKDRTILLFQITDIITVTLLTLCSGGLFSLRLMLPSLRHSISQETMKFFIILYWLFLILISLGLFGVCTARLLCLSVQPKHNCNRLGEYNHATITKWRKRAIICGWGLLLSFVGMFSARLLTARHGVIIWPQTLGYFGGWDAVYIVFGIVCVCSIVIFTIYGLINIRRVIKTKYDKSSLSKVGCIIGWTLTVVGALLFMAAATQIGQSVIFRPTGEVVFMLLSGGFCLLGRSYLPYMKFRHSLLTLLGGAGVGLFIIVFLESWFSLKVPLLWFNGFLGAFVPGLMFLDYGFSDMAIADQIIK